MTIAIGKTQEKRGWFDTVDDWLHHVNHEEHRNCWEHKPHPVARQTQVKNAIASVGTEGVPKSVVGWASSERCLAPA